MRAPWGKIDRMTGESHHLIHHSADVAAVFHELLLLPGFRTRLETATGAPVDDDAITCLSALAFLHDVGKLAPAFQAKGWPAGHGITPRDHLRCGWRWLAQEDPSDCLDGCALHLIQWPEIEEWFNVLFAHHGQPVANPGENWASKAFADPADYRWKDAERQMGQAMRAWFPQILTAFPPQPDPRLAHYIAGLLALADWIGSDRSVFGFLADYDPDYYHKARALARDRLRVIQLDTRPVRLRGQADWALLSDHPNPRPAQQKLAEIALTEPLVILEAETGSGKTEAALWRFARLYQAGLVDSLYFAVPTRAAARQLQARVNRALKRMFADPAPEAVLAIPGQMLAGEAQGIRLPGFQTRWDDGDAPARWAAEHATRYLAAQIAVGTVDQAMMAGLQVKHAHMRGAVLTRSLMVIDEIHASDSWMTRIQQDLVEGHLALGGHVLLMSATLGSAARAGWCGVPLPSFAMAGQAPYPAVWTRSTCHPVAPDRRRKTIALQVLDRWSGADAAQLAVRAARQGARVLVIRNTVDRARETWRACVDTAPELVLTLDGLPTLHHSRFAAEDRARLDQRVEEVMGQGARGCGMIVVGTQTLEQSLDIDADFLITDLAPMDVLLQRIGRLHRHDRARPAGFEQARVVVLAPPQGLGPLTQMPENGLGAITTAASLSGVYTDIAGLAATLQAIREQSVWIIPDMNRALVEAATHPERLQVIAATNGWEDYLRRMTGTALAQMQGAALVTLDRSQPIPDSFPSDEAVRTRLGEEGVILTLPDGTIGPFGTAITRLALPVHWSRGISDGGEVSVTPGPVLTIRTEDRHFHYGPDGLAQVKNT